MSDSGEGRGMPCDGHLDVDCLTEGRGSEDRCLPFHRIRNSDLQILGSLAALYNISIAFAFSHVPPKKLQTLVSLISTFRTTANSPLHDDRAMFSDLRPHGGPFELGGNRGRHLRSGKTRQHIIIIKVSVRTLFLTMPCYASQFCWGFI